MLNTHMTKIGGIWAKQHPKMWDPLLISAAIEASDLKFGTQHEFGFTVLKATFGTKSGEV